MLQKKPRSPVATFVAPLSWNIFRGDKAIKGCRRRHWAPKCAAGKLLIVELSEVLREPSPPLLKAFSERVSTDRDSDKDKECTYVLYSSGYGYSRSMEQIQSAGLIEPDALAARDGTELYQRRYRTPDPYWAKTVCKDWDPKPIEWVMTKFFGDSVIHSADDSDKFGLVYECKDRKQEREELCKRIGDKFKEMGIKARVNERGEGRTVVVTPAAGSAVELVGFCQMMLRVPENKTFIFGREKLLRNCLSGKENLGICSSGCEGDWAEIEDRVFVSKKEGMEALMEGVSHHEIF